MKRPFRFAFTAWSVALVATVATPDANAAEGTLRWQTRSFFGVENCAELFAGRDLTVCNNLRGWTPIALPESGYSHFRLNDTPLPTRQSESIRYEYDPERFGDGIFKMGTNAFDAKFSTTLLKIGVNKVKFDYGRALTALGIVTEDFFSIRGGNVGRELFAVAHGGGHARRLLDLYPINKEHHCLSWPAPLSNICTIYAERSKVGEALDINNLVHTFDLTVEEANPGFTRALESLNAAITEAEVSLIDNARDLDDLAGQLSRLEELRAEVDALVSKGIDRITPEDMDALLMGYPDLPAGVKNAIVGLVADLKRTVQELRDEFARINADFDAQTRGVLELVAQNIETSGFDPDDPDAYRFGGSASVPAIALPQVSSDFDPAHDPYKAYADRVLAQLTTLVVNGKVVNRSAFSGTVRIWNANQRALGRALLQNSVSQAEHGAYNVARERVLVFLRQYLDDQGWYLDNPVPIQVRALFDGTYARILGDRSIELKDALNFWTGNQLTFTQDVMVDMVRGMAHGIAAIEGELAAGSAELARIQEMTTELARVALHIGVGFVPFVGDSLDYCEVTTGRELCVEGGRPLTPEERTYTAAGLALGSGAFWRGAGGVLTATVGEIVEEVVEIYDRRAEKVVSHLRATRLMESRGIRGAAGRLDPGLEKLMPAHLIDKGRKLLLIGDPAVRSSLRIPKDGKVSDFVSILPDGRMVITEVKNTSEGKLKPGVAIEQLEATAAALKAFSSRAELGAVEIAVPHGTLDQIDGDFAISGDQLIKLSSGKVCLVEGLVVKVIEGPPP